MIQKSNIQMRKTAGEIFDAAPTIKAMGRLDEFEVITNVSVAPSCGALSPLL